MMIGLTACSSEKKTGQIVENIATDKKIEDTVSSAETVEVYQDLSTLPKEIQNVLYNNETFFDVEAQKEYTKKSYKVLDNNDKKTKDIDWGRYIVYDFDKDGENELAVIIEVHSAESDMRVFDKQNDKVYAYTFEYRGFLNVYADGAIVGSSAADKFTYYNVKFDKNKRQEIIIANATSEETESGQYEKVWYIGEKKVSEEEFYSFIKRYEETEIVPWSSFSLDSKLT